jgi:uncharacterized membrane protein YciS (DUF1049 family)
MGTLRTILTLAISAAVVISAVVFASSNSTTIDVDYLVGEVSDVAIWKALAVAAAIGATVVGLVLGVAWLRARLESRRYRKAVQGLESELRQLRGGPAPESGLPQAPGESAGTMAGGRSRRGG